MRVGLGNWTWILWKPIMCCLPLRYLSSLFLQVQQLPVPHICDYPSLSSYENLLNIMILNFSFGEFLSFPPICLGIINVRIPTWRRNYSPSQINLSKCRFGIFPACMLFICILSWTKQSQCVYHYDFFLMWEDDSECMYIKDDSRPEVGQKGVFLLVCVSLPC